MDAINNLKIFLKEKNYSWYFKISVILPLFVALVSIDWISKGMAVSNLSEHGQPTGGISGFIKFTLFYNKGAAYGAMADNIALAITLATFVTLFAGFLFVMISDKVLVVGAGILFAGSFANLIARLWGQDGAVVDFIKFDFHLFNSDSYIFNLADLYVNISIGVLILGVIIMFGDMIYMAIQKSKNPRYEMLANYRETVTILIISLDREMIKNVFNFKQLKEIKFKYKTLITEEKRKYKDVNNIVEEAK